ncbi:lipoprotein-releasing ABC transporter ATP-binding protein LolD [Ketobacter sp. MCCC 1A13808]|uniref:lipoprotein-releasing ABC transporter ATP-binding protein LolD n=1 Tax=Ketobacter sp. MCCC 1A13808 TaxID=2602738 RepID=UPI000F2B100A|nr:lipoprotein-releasing ABC transporter ATP-binding protein LolD [Ketobacter sp. MCCC 1A13808]MVF10705.1 lipoprotein-releasing ABC transporter ATP-binding protein LolD [Ketobacter sp. MCCC 1A13808]RLP56123.1 MAG: lipoprotein-releasing ABC transporter ATP-binding protein LolD [Ketobacter sp.]
MSDDVHHTNNPIVLECRDLSKSFDEGPEQIQVLKAINFSLARGDFAAIIGNSGSGKTTLLHLLSGLDTPTSGAILINGRDFSSLNDKDRGIVRNRHIGFVYQFHHLLPEFSALENVGMPLLLRNEAPAEVKRRAAEMLERVGLGHRLRHKPSELSGGERQRVAIARALVTEPACVMADEPTGNLDVHTAKEIQKLMHDLNRSLNISFLIVTHDLGLAQQVDRVVKMEDGHLSEADRESLMSGL